MLEKHVCEFGGIGGFEARNKMSHLCKTVNEYENGVIAGVMAGVRAGVRAGGGQIRDEIARNGFPRAGRNWQWR